jgi:hypothetical protein
MEAEAEVTRALEKELDTLNRRYFETVVAASAASAAEVGGLEASMAAMEKAIARIPSGGSSSGRGGGRGGGGAAQKAAESETAAIKKAIEERKYAEDISAAEIVQIWEDATKKFEKGTKDRETADKELFSARKALAKEQEALDRAAFESSKKWIEERKRNGEISIGEEINFPAASSGVLRDDLTRTSC